MKRIYSLLLLLNFTMFNLLAGPSDYGRDYSMDDNISSGFGPVGTVILFVLGVILVGLLLTGVYNDDNQSSQDKGCITIFFVVLLGVAFLAMMAKCS